MTIPLHQAIDVFAPALPLGVAYSGGADSTALLVACARRWPGQVVALHINHGLQAAAGGFQQHCERFCEALQVPIRVLKIDAAAAAGQSPEDAARSARYEGIMALAIAESAKFAIQSIAIAQHADDQAETLLLALSRGAGLAGLAAMPAQWLRGGLQFHRPLLGVSGAAIRGWLAAEQIAFVEDPSNQSEKFTRNRIRARLLPVLEQVFPQFRDTFARSSTHAAQAQLLLDEMAQADLQQALAGEGEIASALVIARVQMLSRARQGNLLRHWLKTRFACIPSTAQLAELLDQLAACTTRGHQIHLKIGAGLVRRVGDGLTWYNP